MEKLATEETVWKACERLRSEGRKITGRAVLGEVGGSLSTILRYIKTWEARGASDAPVAAEIPADLQESICRALGLSAQEATEALRKEVDTTAAREAEALECLAKYEVQIAGLEKELAESKSQILEIKQLSEKESAVASVTIAELREQIQKLEQENDLLVRTGEASRTEAAKALLQVERADQSASKAEGRILDLEKRVAELVTMKAEAEKGQAVAERHALDLVDQAGKLDVLLQKCGDKISKLEGERDALTRGISAAEAAMRKAEGAGEQMSLRIQEGAATIERLKKELDDAREKPL